MVYAGIVFNLIHNYRVKAYKVGDATLPKLLFYYYTDTPIKYAYDDGKDNLTNTIGWVKYGQPFLVYLAVALCYWLVVAVEDNRKEKGKEGFTGKVLDVNPIPYRNLHTLHHHR
jgi:hypothetical protein